METILDFLPTLIILAMFVIQRTGHGRERSPEISHEAGPQQIHGQYIRRPCGE